MSDSGPQGPHFNSYVHTNCHADANDHTETNMFPSFLVACVWCVCVWGGRGTVHNNFHELMFAFLEDIALPKEGLLLKEKKILDSEYTHYYKNSLYRYFGACFYVSLA